MNKIRYLFTIVALLTMTALGWAIEQTGSLSGAVMEEDGVGLPGVKVTISGPALMGSRSTVTDANGHFRIVNLNVGVDYTVDFILEGFQPVERKNMRIELGKEIYLNQLMKLGTIRETMVVTGSIPVMDSKSSTSQLNISKEIVETMANDRQYQTIMEMMPGAMPGNNPSMYGASTTDNMYQFDGMESTDPLTKTWSTSMNFDNFEEMQVMGIGAPAEYGRGTGAVINVVTKSGSNQLHGTARLSLSKVDWNSEAKDYNISYDDPTRYLNETRPSLNLGGPILKDHIWFFGSWEQRNKWKPGTWYNNWAEFAARTPTGEGKAYYKGHYASAKLTMRFGNFSLMGMWSEDPITMPNAYMYSNYTGYHAIDYEKKQGGWNFNSEATYVLGANTYVTARFSMKRSDLSNNGDARNVTGPSYSRSSYYWGACPSYYVTTRDHNQYQLTLNHFMDTSFGYHDIKAGIEMYKQDVLDAQWSDYPGGEYIVYSASSGRPSIRYVFDNHLPLSEWGAHKYGDITTFFVQDKWEVAKGLTLNLGLRAESQVYKNTEKTDVLKFNLGDTLAPRLGVAYAFGKNKLTANWGRFCDVYSWWLVSNLQPEVYGRWVDVYYGAAQGYPTWTLVNGYYYDAVGGIVDSKLKPQYMDEIGFGYERVLGKNMSLNLSVMHRAWKQKIEDYDPDGDGIYAFANENDFTSINSEDGSSTHWGKTFRKYDAVSLTLKKNLGDDKFQFLVSYNWSKLKGFSSSDTESGYGDHPVYSSYNMLGYLGADSRHQIRFNGSYVLPLDIVFGVNFFWYSGQPKPVPYARMWYEDGGATNWDGSYFAYYYTATPGSNGRYPAMSRMDLRVEKKFEFKKLFTVSVYADVFNVLNRQVAVVQDGYLGYAYFNDQIGGDYTVNSPNTNFGKTTSWSAPRSFFFGAKIEW
jgi:hypothetical protein